MLILTPAASLGHPAPEVAAPAGHISPGISSPAVVPHVSLSPTPSELSSEQSLLGDLPPFPQYSAPGIPHALIRSCYDEVWKSRLHCRAVSATLETALSLVRTERLRLATAEKRESKAIASYRDILNKLEAANSKVPAPSASPGPLALRTGKRAREQDQSKTKRARVDYDHSDAVRKGKAKARSKWRPSSPVSHEQWEQGIGLEDAGLYSDGTGEYIDPGYKSARLQHRRKRKPRRVRKKTITPDPIGKGKGKEKESTPSPPPDDDSEPTDFSAMDHIIAIAPLTSPASAGSIFPRSDSPGPSNPGAIRAIRKAAEVYRQQMLDQVDQEETYVLDPVG